MAKHNAENTRIKRHYFDYLKEAMRRDEASIDAVAKALARFEEANGHKNFKSFHREQAKAFKRKLDKQTNAKTGKPLARATVHSTLCALKAFFIWLASQPGYKSKIAYADADYFNLSQKDVRIAKASREKPVPTLEQIYHVLATMPAASDIEKRNRALVAFNALTGARVGAMASLKLKHIDVAQGVVHQDAREVNTKAAKTFSTWFFPIGGDALAIFTEWHRYLRDNLLFGDDDPLFPKTQIGISAAGGFQAIGLAREGWTNTAPIRDIFKAAFKSAGLPYFHPHLFRHTLTRLGQQICSTPEEFKAWSQNLGHENIMTTFTSYGSVAAHRQAELIKGLGQAKPADDDARLAAKIEQMIKDHHSSEMAG
jgi:integrase